LDHLHTETEQGTLIVQEHLLKGIAGKHIEQSRLRVTSAYSDDCLQACDTIVAPDTLSTLEKPAQIDTSAVQTSGLLLAPISTHTSPTPSQAHFFSTMHMTCMKHIEPPLKLRSPATSSPHLLLQPPLVHVPITPVSI
jgi:hypothetical protein